MFRQNFHYRNYRFSERFSDRFYSQDQYQPYQFQTIDKKNRVNTLLGLINQPLKRIILCRTQPELQT